MIDQPDRLGHLLQRLNAALPIAARVTPELQTTLREQKGIDVPASCAVTWVSYSGDEGGIMCRLDIGAETTNAVFTSITHLRFDPRQPLAREIVAYQKHRVKKLLRQPR